MDEINKTGMRFPPQINPATGRFQTVSGLESVRESIYLILMTQKTERFARRDFGSSILSYTFVNVNRTELNIMAREVTGDILRQEPRVQDVTVSFETNPHEGCIVANVSYIAVGETEEDSITVPLYLERSE